MAKCIRCGKPCASGETMCDECKAWFQEKTGGTVTPGIKRATPPQNDNTKNARDISSASVSESEKGIQENVQDNSDSSETVKIGESHDPSMNPLGMNKVKSVSRKKAYMITASVVVLVAIVIIALVMINKNNAKNRYNVGTVDEARSEDNPNLDGDTIEEYVPDAQKDSTDKDDVLNEIQDAESDLNYYEDIEINDNESIYSITDGHIVNVQASSSLSEYGMTHSADRICDGTLECAWVEGAAGQGIGESVTLFFDGDYIVNQICINGGYQKNKDVYYKNSRPHILKIHYSDGGSELIELDDIYGEQSVDLTCENATNYITLEIESVYEGNKYQDTVISEVSFR